MRRLTTPFWRGLLYQVWRFTSLALAETLCVWRLIVILLYPLSSGLSVYQCTDLLVLRSL